MTRLISVLLPEPLEPTSAVVVPAGAWNETPRSTGCPALYSNQTSSNATSPRDPLHRLSRARILVQLGRHVEDLADPIETGERLGDLRADRRDRDERRGDQADEEDVASSDRRASSRRRESARPPSQIISTPMMPTMTVLPAVVADTPVIDLAMFRNRRCAPLVKTISSRFSAV